MPSQHALLSPSSSHRWLNCTPSAMLEKDIPNQGSDFTREGSLAHAFCARKLKETLKQSHHDEDVEIEELFSDYYTEEMVDHVDTYCQIVLDKLESAKNVTKDAELHVEKRLDFTRWIPDSFGTSDATIIADDLMEVIDFKYGKGVEVSADHNTQMMIYALGALNEFEDEYNIKRIRMTIVQPRLNNLSEFDMTKADLLKWANTELKEKAQIAIKGEGEQKAGAWCKFCRIKNQCKCLADDNLKVFDQFSKQDTAMLTPEQIADTILPKIDQIKAWASSMEEFALQEALKGVTFKGYKIVEGRSVRKITDTAKASKILTDNNYTYEQIYKPLELKTITELEKLVGKKNFGTLMGEVIAKPQGKPTLVPESDKRPAFNAVQDDFNEISK